MRRREVSAKELAKIVSLRQNNSSWLTIEKETTVPRRIAQRAYRDWERSQVGGEFKAARQTVAAEELRNHLESLKKLALVLVQHFDIPRPSPEPQSAKQFLASALSSDIASEYGAYGLPNKLRHPEYPAEVYYRQNQMLLKSLQDHTDRKLNFSSWESAYDTCRAHQTQFLEELRQTLSNIVNLDLKLKRAEATVSKEGKITSGLLDGLVFLLWKSILAGKVELEELVSLIKVFSRGDGRAELAFGNLAQRVIVPDDVGTQAKEACIWAIKNLLAQKDKIIDPLLEDVKTMRRVNDNLAKILNPLTLVPDILHSKCDLCPC